jgi:hypothetical protein
MAIRVERSGARTVVSQRRRALRIAVWSIVFFALVGLAMTIWDALAVKHAQLTCRRSAGTCEIAYSRSGTTRSIKLAEIAGAKLERRGERIAAVLARAGDAPPRQLCEARASASEAAGIRDAVSAIERFLADPGTAEIKVGCDSRFASDEPAPLAVRTVATLGGVALILLGMILYLVEIRTEIDRDAGLVRVSGRSALPRRRWSVERGVADVDGVIVQRRGRGRGRMFAVYLRFTDQTATMVLLPATGAPAKIDGWMAELRQAIGLPPPPSPS